MANSFEKEIYRLHSRLCAGLADPKRILMLYRLAEKPQCVNEISSTLGISQPSASRHLRHLRERGLVVAERDAQSVIYSLPDQRIIEALDLLREILDDILANQASLSRTVSAAKPSPTDSQEQAS
ncbi:MAG: metalloregulator ArsR/SmtB family transcription factor [Anaerolineales bacterium]|jgi:ArsR family transcriptional regulator